MKRAGFTISSKSPLRYIAAAYIVMAISAGIGCGDEMIFPLMWAAVLLTAVSMKAYTEESACV